MLVFLSLLFGLGLLSGITVMLIILIIPIAILYYLFMAMGLSTIARRENYDKPWLAWIPFANIYLLAKIAYKDTLLAFVMLGLNVFGTSSDEVTTSSLFNAPMTNFMGIAYSIMLFVGLYNIYKRYSTKASLMLILTIFSGSLLYPIFIFSIRNNRTIKGA